MPKNKNNNNDKNTYLRRFLSENDVGTEEEIREGLYYLIVVASKYLLNEQDRKVLLDITKHDFPFVVDGFYESLREVFNKIDSSRFCNMANDPDMSFLIMAAKELFGGLPERITIEHRGNSFSRIIEEIMKLYRDDRFHTKDKQLARDLNAYMIVFREMFKIQRSNLSVKQFNQIPEGLKLDIDSKTVLVKELFQYNEENNRYSLVQQLSNVNARKLQIQIARYMIICMKVPSSFS
jgi:hypothetical protein